MAIRFSIPLRAGPDQVERLLRLQEVFVQACNSLTPLVRETRCWNRVGLHHLAYRRLREQFPQLGSQMSCNAIYSVSRACRLVYQNGPGALLPVRHPDAPLPLIMFEKRAPVFFDRHTLSLRDGGVSMFTLDGRMRFQVDLGVEQEAHFVHDRLREVVLQPIGGLFHLCFVFTPADADESLEAHGPNLPEYLIVQHPAAAPGLPTSPPAIQPAENPLTGVA